MTASLAVVGTYEPRVGDRVLVVTAPAGEKYIVGVLSALRKVKRTLEASDGTQAVIETHEGVETVRVHDAAGALLFEHRPREGKSVVFAPEGNLEFRADHGRIDFVARDAVNLASEHDVSVVGRDRVQLTRPATERQQASTVSLDARGMTLATASLDARAQKAEFAAGEMRLIAGTVDTAVETARHVVGVLETQATRIFERARNAYREVTELSQTRAGRMRLVADTTFHMFGKRTLIKGETEVKVKSEKIHLA